MKLSLSLAMFVGVLLVALGVAGFIVPNVFVQLGWFWATDVGLYVSAALDILIGLVLLAAAPSSRSPVGLSVFAAFSLIGGVLTPFLGQGRAYSHATWWAAQGPLVLRMWATLVLAVGVLIICAAVPRRRALRTAHA